MEFTTTHRSEGETALRVDPGDKLELRETEEGFLLKPVRVDLDRLAPLRGKLCKGLGTFNLKTFRERPHDPSLRD